MKLLIADDDLTTRTMLTAITQKWGFEPIIAEDGEAAWQILQEKDPPNLLLLDWMSASVEWTGSMPPNAPTEK